MIKKYVLFILLFIFTIIISSCSWQPENTNDSYDRIIDIEDSKQNLINKEDVEKTIIKTYKVLKVIDWDTVDINYNWKSTRLRLIWIDSPESTTLRNGSIECYWKEASDYLRNILNWKNVSIELDETQWNNDKYGRLLAYIFLEWENLNNKIILDWYAKEYTYNKPYKYIDLFKKSEKIAKENNIWLWWKCIWNEIIPIGGNIDCNIKWNISYTSKEKIYHLPWCPDYNRTKINISKWENFFCSEKEAIKAGWRIAKNCY